MAQFLGVSLGQAGLPIAALKHLELAARWAGDQRQGPIDRPVDRHADARNPRLSAWEKNPYRLLPAPEGVTDAFRESFERAMGWAEEGLWASAASAFELLSAGSSAGAAADRNRGLCCLWIADHEPPASPPCADTSRAPARRPTRSTSRPSASVLEGDRGGETVEFIHLTWPIRDRAGLLRALEAGPHFDRGPRATHPPRRPGLVPDRELLPARPPADRGEARPDPPRHPDGRGRGDRRRECRRAGDLRRQPAQPADRPVHGRGPRDDPPGAPADQGHREGARGTCWR